MKKRPQRLKRRRIPVPIASMGDIAFLLIIFFMVYSEANKDRSNLDAEPPKSRHVKEVEVTVAARVAIDKMEFIYFDGVQVESVKDVEWGVRALLANTVTDDQRHVQFKCDAGLPKEVFEPVLKAIAAAGGIIEAVGELVGEESSR